MHVIAAKAVAFGEALQPDFKQYIQQVKKNASVLGEVLMANGYRYRYWWHRLTYGFG